MTQNYKFGAIGGSTNGIDNFTPPPKNIVDYGFVPPSSGRTGSPIVAQWLNWLFARLWELTPYYVVATGNPTVITNPLRDGSWARTKATNIYKIEVYNTSGALKMQPSILDFTQYKTTSYYTVSKDSITVANVVSGDTIVITPLR